MKSPICKMGPGDVCTQCGAPMFERLRQPCPPKNAIAARANHPKRVDPTDCPYYLGAAVPAQSVKVYGCGCSASAKNGTDATVSACDIHGLCLTSCKGKLARGVEIKRCLDCHDRPLIEANAPAPLQER